MGNSQINCGNNITLDSLILYSSVEIFVDFALHLIKTWNNKLSLQKRGGGEGAFLSFWIGYHNI